MAGPTLIVIFSPLINKTLLMSMAEQYW